jgi:tetratricopeptide (TPR) repeat protein
MRKFEKKYSTMTMYRIGVLAVLLVLLGGGICTRMVWADDYQDAGRLFKEGKRAEALDRVNAFLAQHPKDARARFLKGVILTEQSKTEDAVKVFTELTQDYPELPEPYNNLAVLYASQGDYQKARKALEMAIRTHPSYAVAHENLGDIYATLASQAYDKALQLDSSNATARKKLALIKELVPAKSAATLARAEPEKPASAPPVSKPEAQETPAAPKPGVEQPTPEKPTGEKTAGDADATGAVVKMLEGWAHAWSNNDADAYLSFYAPDFVTPNGEAHKDWEAARRQRLAKPRKIKVTASSPRVKFADNTHAVVTFRQSYSSANLKAVGTKSLKVVRLGERWLIQQELIDK